VTTLMQRYLALDPEPALLVFRTRLGLTAFHLTGSADGPAAAPIASRLVREAMASRDGYAARDMLVHDQLGTWHGDTGQQALTESIRVSGLGRGTVPDRRLAALHAAMETSEVTTKLAAHVTGPRGGAA
jgi:hypothetical protein